MVVEDREVAAAPHQVDGEGLGDGGDLRPDARRQGQSNPRRHIASQFILESTLLANDGDADGDAIFIYQIDAESRFGGSVSLSGTGEVLYVPAADFNGSDTFAYFISDRHGGTAQALVTVTVLDVGFGCL